MPIYEYECAQCQKIHEIIQKFSDAPLTTCPDCGAAVHKKISKSSFSLKGSGWYTTDYKRKAPESSPAAGSEKPASAESKSGAGGDSTLSSAKESGAAPNSTGGATQVQAPTPAVPSGSAPAAAGPSVTPPRSAPGSGQS